MAIFAIGTADPDVTTGQVLKHAYRGSRLLTLLPVDPHASDATHSFPTGINHANQHNGVTDSNVDGSNRGHGQPATNFNTALLQLIGKTLNGLGELLNSMSKTTSDAH